MKNDIYTKISKIMNFEIETLNRNNLHFDEIPGISLIDADNLTYNDFFYNYMVPNIPCMIKNITGAWEATKFWIKDNKPNFDYLSEKYGCSEVTIYNCSKRYYNSQETEDSTLEKYINYWIHSEVDNNNVTSYYLKDWHLKLKNKDDNYYEVPLYFASDWLNEYYTEKLDDDYRFVYMGSKNTWTPFHADVFTSYSWSANVCGRKKWILFPPGEENYLLDSLANLPYDITELNHSRKYYEVIQNPGEAIFVPSGWHHQVWNLEDTISINHNWVNGCNIKTMWCSMKKCLDSVCREIENCRTMEGFEEHCQVMLNSVFGMDYYKFYEFLKFIAVSRIDMLKHNKSRILFHDHKIGFNLILFDLEAVKSVLELFLNCEEVNTLPYFQNMDLKPQTLIEQIVGVLETNS